MVLNLYPFGLRYKICSTLFFCVYTKHSYFWAVLERTLVRSPESSVPCFEGLNSLSLFKTIVINQIQSSLSKKPFKHRSNY